MPDDAHFKALLENDPKAHIALAITALSEPDEADLYKARTHLHRALMILNNDDRYKDIPP